MNPIVLRLIALGLAAAGFTLAATATKKKASPGEVETPKNSAPLPSKKKMKKALAPAKKKPVEETPEEMPEETEAETPEEMPEETEE